MSGTASERSSLAGPSGGVVVESSLGAIAATAGFLIVLLPLLGFLARFAALVVGPTNIQSAAEFASRQSVPGIAMTGFLSAAVVVPSLIVGIVLSHTELGVNSAWSNLGARYKLSIAAICGVLVIFNLLVSPFPYCLLAAVAALFSLAVGSWTRSIMSVTGFALAIALACACAFLYGISAPNAIFEVRHVTMRPDAPLSTGPFVFLGESDGWVSLGSCPSSGKRLVIQTSTVRSESVSMMSPEVSSRLESSSILDLFSKHRAPRWSGSLSC